MPYFVAAGLLATAGVGKLARPVMTASALAAARLPGGVAAARAIGFAEVSLGAVCLAAPTRVSASVLAVVYAAFAVFVALLMRAGYREVSCGCFGVRPARLSRIHVAFDLIAGAAAAATVFRLPGNIADFLLSRPLAGVPEAAGMALATYLSFLVLTELPERWSGGQTRVASVPQVTTTGGAA